MSNGPGEKFCLRWNDFEKNINTSFKSLREDKDFFDVTLACGNSQIQGHKVILSACSSFFHKVLKQNPHQHPLLYLKGVRYEDITSILNFMYHGEVSVAQEELNTFLAVAEDLKVKGLYQHDQTKHPKDYLEPKETKPLPSERTHKQKGSTEDYQEINRRPISLPRETHNPQPEIKIEASVNVGDEEEEENHSVVRTDYYDNTGYEEEQYQQDYEEQAQYETVALNQSPGKVFSAGRVRYTLYMLKGEEIKTSPLEIRF
jgi:hypothetical protein